MKKVAFVFTLVILVLIVFLERRDATNQQNGRVLSEEITSSVLVSPTPSILIEESKPSEILSPTPSATKVPTPTSIPTLVPTKKPSPTPTPSPQPKFTSQEINGFIDRFAGQYGVSPDILRHLALCESGFNPQAKKLNYAGLFQFNASTWIKYRKILGEDSDPNLRFNAEEAVQTTAYVISLGKTFLWPNCYPK